MNLYIYSIVKLIIAGHVLRQVWFLLFRDHLFGLWDRLLMPAHKPAQQQKSVLDNEEVVGKTQTRYLDDPDNPQPVAFIPMELVQGAREEEQRDEEAYCDTERRTLKQIFRDNERFEEQTEEQLSSGRSFDQLVHDTQHDSTSAPKPQGTQQLTAAQMAEFVTRQEENNAAIAKMLTRALDQKERSLGPNKRPTENFDWGKYL